MKYEFHPEAELELYEAASRYESDVPEPGSRLDDELRHFVPRKFPFSVVYAVTEDLVHIVAVAHGSREPEYWRLRVQDR